jgi:hypothetical protein
MTSKNTINLDIKIEEIFFFLPEIITSTLDRFNNSSTLLGSPEI